MPARRAVQPRPESERAAQRLPLVQREMLVGERRLGALHRAGGGAEQAGGEADQRGFADAVRAL